MNATEPAAVYSPADVARILRRSLRRVYEYIHDGVFGVRLKATPNVGLLEVTPADLELFRRQTAAARAARCRRRPPGPGGGKAARQKAARDSLKAGGSTLGDAGGRHAAEGKK